MKILQIAYYFPPLGGAGVQRALKFSRYLPDFGVQPVVLAASDSSYVQDESLAAELAPGLCVRRVADSSLLRRWLRWRADRQLRQGATSVPPSPAKARPAPAPQSPAKRFCALDARSRRWRDVALRTYAAFRFPDAMVGWARAAESEALRLIAEERIDLVFSSSPPVSAHALAARVAKARGLPWVADFRDLWTDNPAYDLPPWRRALDRRREDGWLRQAAGIVVVTPSWREMLVRRVDDPRRVAFIPNGYDEADFAATQSRPGDQPCAGREDAPFRVVHTGTFYGPRDPAALLAGVARYLRRPARSARSLRLRLVGNMGVRFAASLGAFDAAHPGVVERVDYLPHRAAIAELEGADALLLVIGGDGAAGLATAGWLPGKVFEYLRVGKPVLLLGDPEGDCARLVREHTRGEIVDAACPDAIADALAALIAADSTQQMPDTRDVARFERRRLAGELADFLKGCR